MSKNLFAEAIADAKKVKEAALINAKKALEESITPKLQSMIAAKLQEMEGEDEDLYEAEDLDENQEELDEEIDLDEADDETSDEDSSDDFGAEEDFEVDDEVETSDGMESEDISIADLSVDEFKELIRDVVQQEMGGGTEADLGGDLGAEPGLDDTGDDFGAEGGDDLGADLGDDMAPEGGEEEEVDLDELLAELDNLDEGEDDLDESKEYEPKANTKTTAVKGGATKVTAKGGSPGTGAPGFKKVGSIKESEYKQAIKTINTLRKELNEVNLLNSKLLYVNKLFKTYANLTESQKLRVIESFDKATTVEKSKLVYNTLNESFKKKSSTKQTIKEHLGFASKPIGGTKSQTIVPDATIARFQKLANI